MKLTSAFKWLPLSLWRFVLVGAVGFAVDGSILTLFAVEFGFNVYVSRVASFLSATLVTWLLNRRFVFDVGGVQQNHAREYLRYFLVQMAGALANLSLFSLLVAYVPAWKLVPVVPLFFGAFLGLAVNYSGVRCWVYRGRVRQ
jgi:putative flippase GtrA